MYTSGFLSPTATSVTIPGGALSPGQSYTFDLLFSEQVFGEVDASPGIGTTQFYDTHTDGSFSTAAGVVPEPSTWAMLIIGFGGMGRTMRRRALAVAKAA